MFKHPNKCTTKEEYSEQNFSNITVEDFQSMFVQSGSSVFGNIATAKDIDFLVPPEECTWAWAITKFFRAEREDYKNPNLYSYSFVIPTGERINTIIFKDSKWYEGYVAATEDMSKLETVDHFKPLVYTKLSRCLLFQTFCEIYLRKGEKCPEPKREQF